MLDDYYKNLPKKRMGAAALIMNEKEEILIVKPSYKDGWTTAGGVVEENESPRAACVREVKEEIGLSLPNLRFLCVDYTYSKDEKGESLQFVFYAGKLTEQEIKNIKIDGKEIIDYKFVSSNEVQILLRPKQKNRIEKCLEALKNKTVIYLENGR